MPTLQGISKHGPVHVQAVLGGLLGFDIINEGDGTVTGEWFKLVITEDITITTGDIVSGAGEDLETGTYAAGTVIEGYFTSINIDDPGLSGALRAYRW